MAARSRQAPQSKTTPPPGPVAFARSLRLRRLLTIAIAIVFLATLSGIDYGGGVLTVNDDWHRYHDQTFEVVRVIDGDTLDLRVRDGDSPVTRVRLWGIDTPEIAKPQNDRPAEPWADEATAMTRELTEGQSVTLRLQRHRTRGRFGRLLAYVVLPDGQELNGQLLQAGLAEHDDRWSHDQTADYADLERLARQQGVGIWSE